MSKFEAIMNDIERELDVYEAAVREAQEWWTAHRERNRMFRAVKRDGGRDAGTERT